MPDQYQFGIRGTIGPLIQSCLPGLNAVPESERTVLTGTVGGPDDLRRVLDLLDARGTPAVDVRISYRHDEPPPSRDGTANPIGTGGTFSGPGQ